jgi:hypothetical protein
MFCVNLFALIAPTVRGALEIGTSPARPSPVPRATTPEEWPASPGVLKRLYDNRETEMSSDADSSRASSPVVAYHDVEMGEVDPQLQVEVNPEPEPETVPETPQVPLDSQPQYPSPPPPAQPPRPRSPPPSSSNPQIQNHLTSPSSIHTSVQAVSGSQLPSFEKPPAWARLDDEPSNGPSFELPWTQREDPLVAVLKPTPGSHLSPEKQAIKPPSPATDPTRPAASKPPQEKETAPKKASRVLAFGESVIQAIEKAFQERNPGEVAPPTHDSPAVLSPPKVTVAQLPPPEPRSKPPSKVTQTLPGPSPSDRLMETEESPVRQPLQALDRKVPVPEVGPPREAVRGRNENGAPTMVLIPASDDTRPSSSLKQSSSSQPVQSSQSIPSSHPIPPSAHPLASQLVPSSEPQVQHSAPQLDTSIAQEGDSVVVHVNETVADIETVQDLTVNTQSSLEYASTQDEDKTAAGVEPRETVDKSPKVVVVIEKVADEQLGSPLPQIAAIREVESQRSPIEVDELDGDSEADDFPPVVKRKSKRTPSNPRSRVKKPQPSKPAKPNSSSESSSKLASRTEPVVEKVPSRSSSKLPPKPIVLIERKRTPAVLTDERTSTAQKRRLGSPSEEGFPMPQPIKRSRTRGHRHPVQTTLPPIPRTPSPLPQEQQDHVVSNPSRSAKGKGRAEGIKGLEKINVPEDTGKEEAETVQAQVKKKGPDTGSKRKPSDAFSAQDNSRDVKRPKVAEEPEPRKLGKQLSFVDPNKVKRPFHGKPQIRKASVQRATAATAVTESSAMAEPDKGVRTSKYFNPQIYREPEYPPITTTPEAERSEKVFRSKGAVHLNGHDFGDPQRRVGSRKASTSNLDHQLPEKSRKPTRVPDDGNPPGRSAVHTRAQHSRPVKDSKRDFVGTEPQYPTARKLGSFAPDLNPPPLPGLPGGRLMNKQLRDILIRTGKVRKKEASAA